MTVNFIFDTATLNSRLSSEQLKQEIDISSGNEGSKNENKIGTFFFSIDSIMLYRRVSIIIDLRKCTELRVSMLLKEKE